jgi:predicted NUDIX family phosphoesterase
MTTSLPGLNWTPDEIALAERLGREGRERIHHRMSLGTSFLRRCQGRGRPRCVGLGAL